MKTTTASTGRAKAPGQLALIALVAACLVTLLGCVTTPPGQMTEHPRALVVDSLRHPPVGDVIGTAGRYGGTVWRGIPYAAPPVGERRFRAPEPAARWTDTREAAEFGSLCPQYASSTNTKLLFLKGDIIGNEDCLFLNVYAPTSAKPSDSASAEPLPVMFWINGGGNTSGTASFYNGSRLAEEYQVVVVTISYRLGFLGWFRHRALR
ncbi:MAG: carboxylesterase family protein, partial [Myxococcota bacterium]